MTTLQKQVALIVLGLALLYWLAKRNASPATATTSATGATTPGGGGAAAGGAAVAKPATPPLPVDVAGSVSDGTADFALQNGDLAGSTGWVQNAFDQLWYPASQIPLSNLTAEDYAYAQDFLENSGGEFTRRDDMGQLGAALIASANSNAGAALFNTIAGSVLSIIPVVGQAFSKVTAAQNQQLASSTSWQDAMGNGTLGGLLRTNLGQPTAQTMHLLANYSDANTATGGQYGDFLDGPEAPLDRRVMEMPTQVGLQSLQHFEPNNPVLYAQQNGAAKQFRLRLRLWTKYEGGYILPWLSWHTNGDPTEHYGCKQTVNARARILRAVDVLICQSQPYTRENAPHGYWCDTLKSAGFLSYFPRFGGSGTLSSTDRSVYFYKNGFVGPMLGSIFPPTAEDVRYIGTDRRTYSYYGEPMDNPTGSIGYIDDLDVNPADASKLAARNAAAAVAAAAAAAAKAAQNAADQAADQAAANQDASADAQRMAGTLPCSVDDGSCTYWMTPPRGTPQAPGGVANQPGWKPPATTTTILKYNPVLFKALGSALTITKGS